MFESAVAALTTLGLAAIAVLILLIIKALIDRRGPEGLEAAESFREAQEQSAEAGDLEEPEAKPKKETDRQRLTRVEKELAGREARMKAEKMRELGEREHLIRMRGEEYTPPEPDYKLDHELDQPAAGLEKERERIQELMRKAEGSYASGGLEEEHFKRIMADYQRQILELDVKMRKDGRSL